MESDIYPHKSVTCVNLSTRLWDKCTFIFAPDVFPWLCAELAHCTSLVLSSSGCVLYV